jgi:N-acyl homoserine lactone hydrolase
VGYIQVMSVHAADVRRVHFGYIVSPAGYPDAGQPLPVSGFLVPHRTGTLLFDTGLAPIDDETRERYHPRVRTMVDSLASVGADLSDIDVIANCHLHADHAGGNHHFPNVRVIVQRAELDAARQPDFTYPQYAFEYSGATLDVVAGETDIGPGLRLVPTPGHTPGHQSLLVDTDAGRWLLAGQASNTSWTFSAEAFSAQLAAAGLDPVAPYPDWMPHLREWGVQQAYFAHDLMVWHRDDSDLGHPALA